MKQTRFKLLICDFDTALFRAAKFVQEDYITVKNKVTGEEREWKNRTAFYGHHNKKAEGWLGETNKFLNTEVSWEDFEITDHVRPMKGFVEPLDEAKKNFDIAVGHVKNSVDCEDYRLVIGGKENFRYAIAKEAPYKGERAEKPIYFAELTAWAKEKYKSKIIIAEGREADDVLSEYGYNNFRYFSKHGEWLYLLSYIDKDIKMVVSPMINPDKISEGIIFNTPLEASLNYAKQLLTGDESVDNIKGLPDLTVELREKYGVRKGKGLGDKTAWAMLEGSESPKEAFERVVEAYKAYYGPKKKHKFTNYQGEDLAWNWKHFLSERANLLWMYRTPDCRYDIFRDTFDKLNVKY